MATEPRICPACGSSSAGGARFCSDCGAPLSEAAPAGREGRKVVTALFADVVGSTALGERLDPEDFRAVVGGAVDRMVAAVERLGGTVKDLAGDGVLALFGAPAAHEDDPERAVLAGLGLMDDVGEYARAVEAEWGIESLAVRVGIETGLVVVGLVGAGQKVEYGATGDALNTTARLQSAARPGTVLVGAATHRLIDPLFEWGERRELSLKGKSEPVVAYEARRARPGTGRRRGLQAGDVRLVGRDDELAVATAAVEEALAGAGGVLFVTGEAGLGKSRLVAELRPMFERGASDRGRTLWLEGRCVSYGETLPYLPLQGMLGEWLGAAGAPIGADTSESLRARLEEIVGERAAELHPYLALVLGLEPPAEIAENVAMLSPEALQRRIFSAVGTLLRDLAAPGPVAVVLDDLHWADPSSIQLIEHLLGLTDEIALLVVLAARPERDHPSWRLRETASRRVPRRTHEISLGALPDPTHRNLLEALVGAGTLPAELERQIVERGEGNPLYLEELVRSLADAGALVSEGAGWRFDHEAPVEVPATVERIVLARIDRLRPEAHDALAGASVVGRQFGLPVLEAVVGDGALLAGALDELERLDLVREVARWPEPEYRFKHSLIQEATYRSLLKRRRQELHLKAARALESIGSGPVEERQGVLAHHFEAAGDLERAASCHVAAAEAAERLYALPEAIQHYTSALEAVSRLEHPSPDLPPQHALQLRRGNLRVWAGDWQAGIADAEESLAGARAAGDRIWEIDALHTLGSASRASDHSRTIGYLQAALDTANSLGDEGAAVRILARLSIQHSNQLELERAIGLGEEALATARRRGDEDSLSQALDCLKLAALMTGDVAGLDRITSQLTPLLRSRRDLQLLQYALLESAFVPLAQARFDEASSRIDEALSVNRETGTRGTESLFLDARCWLQRSRGAYRQAIETGETAVAVARAVGMTEFVAWSEATLGWALLDVCAHAEAARHLERGLEDAERSSARNQTIRCMGLLARALLALGEEERARELAGTARDLLAEISAPAGKTFLFGAHAYLAVAAVERASGRAEEGAQLVGPVVNAAESAGWKETIASGSVELARCREMLGDGAEAERLASRGLAVAEDARTPRPVWEAHATLARLQRAAGREAEAGEHEARAAAIVEGIAGELPDGSLAAGLREQALPARA